MTPETLAEGREHFKLSYYSWGDWSLKHGQALLDVAEKYNKLVEAVKLIDFEDTEVIFVLGTDAVNAICAIVPVCNHEDPDHTGVCIKCQKILEDN